jgi:polyhydroxyalkanoate synthase
LPGRLPARSEAGCERRDAHIPDHLYQQNKLVRGEFLVDGRRVDLSAVTMPILNIYSETDTIIHPLSSKALRSHVGSEDYTEMPMAGGHIGVLVARSRKFPDGIAEWLQKH